MVDSVLILVDAMDGPMPQTRFVTQKAFAMGFKPIVVVNKIDRPGARPDWVVNQVFDLFDRLGATDEQLDFPTVYASALNGYAGMATDMREGNMDPLFQAIVEHVAAAEGRRRRPVPDADQPARLQQLRRPDRHRPRAARQDQDQHAGQRGRPRRQEAQRRVLQVLGFMGLERREVQEAQAGDIIAITGIEELGISDTVCAPTRRKRCRR
jgi:GTP-binding protein